MILISISFMPNYRILKVICYKQIEGYNYFNKTISTDYLNEKTKVNNKYSKLIF
jgi:hypothetical protein